jgi:hypothetical protein
VSKKPKSKLDEIDMEEDEAGTQPYVEKEHSSMDPGLEAIAKEKQAQEELRAAATQEYEEKMSEVEPQEEPPAEAPSHEGQVAYVLSSDVNIAHRDYKKGDAVMLTYEQYQSLRGVGVYCEPREVAEA